MTEIKEIMDVITKDANIHATVLMSGSDAAIFSVFIHLSNS